MSLCLLKSKNSSQAPKKPNSLYLVRNKVPKNSKPNCPVHLQTAYKVILKVSSISTFPSCHSNSKGAKINVIYGKKEKSSQEGFSASQDLFAYSLALLTSYSHWLECYSCYPLFSQSSHTHTHIPYSHFLTK